jgi:hypothetical protein
MKASALYDTMEQRVDQLQKVIKNGIRDQLVNSIALESTQEKMRALQEIMVKSGNDRDLSDEELTALM